ncbi:MAG TPA: methylated-DNA--[protein]-cysteine S-methyltransferase [Candidatus Binataceae bacterium]|jgi:methylated-DNA-[protein]-cysteine S-methyltransferase|nr:methylated-DNA--[protein]-cysteine S-methyltransferase [Candidatus Binataceae bacterium]
MKIQAAIDSVGRQFGDDQVEELLRAARRGFNQAFDLIRRPQAALGVVKSPLGDLLVAASSRGVVLNHYVRDGADLAATIGRLRLYFDPVDDRSTAEEIGQEVRGYLAGDAKALRHKVDLTLAQSEFQKMVLAKLRAVPRGAVLSYRALSAVTGSPNAARAVGNALHNNPVPVYVPCHRVIAHDGGIGGYGGGLPSKLQLLRAEGFTVDNTGARISDHTVWGNKGTRIYCRPQCRTTARVDRTHVLFFADSKQAQRAGMRPCKLCRPS